LEPSPPRLPHTTTGPAITTGRDTTDLARTPTMAVPFITDPGTIAGEHQPTGKETGPDEPGLFFVVG